MEFAFAIRLQRYSKAGTLNEFMEEKKMQPLVFVYMAYLSGVYINILICVLNDHCFLNCYSCVEGPIRSFKVEFAH